MTRIKNYFILAGSMAILGLAEAVSGFVLWLGFPTGGGGGGRGLGAGGGQLTFWEISKYTWIDIHDWVAVALVVLVVIHVALHWKWIIRMAKSLVRPAPKRVMVTVDNNQPTS